MVGATIACPNDRCTTKPADDEPPAFNLDLRKRSAGLMDGEGTRSGRIDVREDKDSFAIVGKFGPARQGKRLVSEEASDSMVASLYIEKSTRKFVGILHGAVIQGECD
ncbi:hypothetical protein C3941_06575 [Kaistia algarum]|nr:hypothetical protein C3941_06575 [Kaistia algarum]